MPIKNKTAFSKKVFLVQTDTTVGFLSRDDKKLEEVKARLPGKQFLKVFADLKSYKATGGRVPEKYKAIVRRAKKTTFIVKGQAFRIARDTEHNAFLKRYGWMYSTSANRSGHHYERDYCTAKADIIVEDFRGLHEDAASSLVRLGRETRRKLR